MNQDVAAPDPDETQGDGQHEPVPHGHVPLERLNEVIDERNNAREALARSQGNLEAMQSQPATRAEPPAAQQYTREQLTAAVDTGQISQVEADRIHDSQTEVRITKHIRNEVAANAIAVTSAQSVGDELNRYRAADPTIDEIGSESRNRLEKEYAYLTGKGGSPRSSATELAALRAVFGDADTLAQRGTRDTHTETGGAGGGSGGSPDTSNWAKGMPAKNKRYYSDQIAKGYYTEKSAQQEWANA